VVVHLVGGVVEHGAHRHDTASATEEVPTQPTIPALGA
jgi:hypothetical protein